MQTSRDAGVSKEATSADDAGRRARWPRSRNAVRALAITSLRAKGGISVMAKKTAKGGKKKGGKKR
jgi:hypothetical protein